jgi:adenylyltransferase/sulfurtransferase
MKTPPRPRAIPSARTLAVIGLGNIGSQLIDLLAPLPWVARLVLLDKDAYEVANLASQNITPAQVGLPKATAQARRLRRLHPRLQVEACVADVAEVPWGWLRADAIVACLDSLEGRLRVNEIAWRLGVPWLDGGIEATGSLVRVNAYLPGPGQPCGACALDDADYRNLSSRQPCQAASRSPVPTAAPPALGAVAAGLLATECAKLFGAQTHTTLLGHQVILDLAHHRHYLTQFRRNARCRFDHGTWRMEPFPALPRDATLGRLLAQAQRLAGAPGPVRLAVPGQVFARALHCPGCGRSREQLHLLGRLPARLAGCASCHGRAMQAVGFKILERLDSDELARSRDTSLSRLGFRHGELLAIQSPRRTGHYLLHFKP